MISYRLLLAAAFLMSANTSWAMENDAGPGLEELIAQARAHGDYKSVLWEILDARDVARLKELVPEINACQWRPRRNGSWGDPVESLVYTAVLTGNAELLGLFLDIDGLKPALEGGVAIACATEEEIGNNEALIHALISRGAKLHESHKGQTPLSWSEKFAPVFFSHPEFFTEELVTHEYYGVIQHYLENKMLDPNRELGENKDRPLHVICRRFGKLISRPFSDGNNDAKDLWDLFIQHGANPELTNAHGQTPKQIFLDEAKRPEAKWLALTKYNTSSNDDEVKE